MCIFEGTCMYLTRIRGRCRDKKGLAQVRLVALDVDGILTDGMKYYISQEKIIRSFHARDGLGVYLLVKAGIHVTLISNDKDSQIIKRAEDLCIDDVYLGVNNKAETLRTLKLKLGFEREEVLYMGDDLWDVPAFYEAKYAVTVPEAPLLVKKHANWVTENRGGHGAVREVADIILENHKFDSFAILDLAINQD